MQFLFIVLGATFGFLFGFNIAIIAGALPLFSSAFDLSTFQQGLIAAALPFGAVIGVAAVIFTVDRFGRRPVLLGSSVAFAIGILLGALAPEFVTLLLGRAIAGAAIGVSTTVAPMYLAEISPARVRGAAVATFQLMVTTGILIAYCISWILTASGDWRLMFAIGLIPAAISFAGMVWAPESPRWLLLSGQSTKARKIFKTVQPNMETAEMEKIIQEVETLKVESSGDDLWSALFRPPVLAFTIFAAMTFLLQQLCGINEILIFAPLLFKEAGLSGANSQLLATVGVGVVLVTVTIVTMLVIDRLGRRPLYIWGFVGAFVSMSFIAANYLFPGVMQPLYVVLAFFAFIVFFSISIGPLPWIYLAEVFPLPLRRSGMAAVSLFNWTWFWIIVLVFPSISAALGPGIVFSFFAVVGVFGIWYTWKYAPETAGIELEEVEDTIEKDNPNYAG
ncbi:sugar porter family MFS transporter [Roseibium sp. RKSG952]|uniref:sugar porter family MFS transporter n=1 Tax=Roseibium sp. RKSG952 TaxID=2529384 RepID=UPI0018AD2762|nr:sugar porter family MFS transporter [Roseibium sp. RKSG952]